VQEGEQEPAGHLADRILGLDGWAVLAVVFPARPGGLRVGRSRDPREIAELPGGVLKALRHRRSSLDRWAVARRNQGYAAHMSDSTSQISPPPKPPEREAEIRELLAQVAQGDLSGTIPWEEVAAELGLPGRGGS
jgi:hypothetical protein